MFEAEKKIVYIGSDHLGHKLKGELKDYFDAHGFQFIDLGCFSKEECKYEMIAREVSEKVSEKGGEGGVGGVGILLAGNGVDACEEANKNKGIKAVCAHDEAGAEKARVEGKNVLGMDPGKTDFETAKKIISKFLGI